MPSPLSGKDTIDHLIIYCQRNGIFTQDKPNCIHHCYGGKPAVIGNIAFDCYNHSTGNSVEIWVINGENSRQIVSTTYWFSSSYTFNESKRESGPWDKALNEAINKMTAAVSAHKAEVEAKNKAYTEERAKKEKAEVDSWASVFKD